MVSCHQSKPHLSKIYNFYFCTTVSTFLLIFYILYWSVNAEDTMVWFICKVLRFTWVQNGCSPLNPFLTLWCWRPPWRPQPCCGHDLQWYTVCPEKVAGCRMLLEPVVAMAYRWAISAGLGRACLWNLFFGRFSPRLLRNQALPSHIHGKIWPHSTQFWLGFLGSSSILLASLFWTLLEAEKVSKFLYMH